MSFLTSTTLLLSERMIAVVNDPNSSETFMDIASLMMTLSVITILLLTQVLTISAALGGGIALTTLNAGSALSRRIENSFSPSSSRFKTGQDEGKARTVGRDLSKIQRGAKAAAKALIRQKS